MKFLIKLSTVLSVEYLLFMIVSYHINEILSENEKK